MNIPYPDILLQQGVGGLNREASGSTGSQGWGEGGPTAEQEAGSDTKSLSSLLGRLGFKKSPQPQSLEGQVASLSLSEAVSEPAE